MDNFVSHLNFVLDIELLTTYLFYIKNKTNKNIHILVKWHFAKIVCILFEHFLPICVLNEISAVWSCVIYAIFRQTTPNPV
jgi:hypothetical protein